jgi:DNA-directed RNA polymerase specialized sigma24 family protein
MLVDEVPIRQSLTRMIRKMTANAALRDDLLQEASIHLWLTELARPGQTRSWFLQSCKYHLMHYLAAGRSVDSAKRRAGQLEFAEDSEECDWIVNDDSGGSVVEWVSARDIMALLIPHLHTQEKAVLECFADGLRVREIGRKLKMSHTMVIRHRRKIASLLNRLESRGHKPAVSAKLNRFARELGAIETDTILPPELAAGHLSSQRLIG